MWLVPPKQKDLGGERFLSSPLFWFVGSGDICGSGDRTGVTANALTHVLFLKPPSRSFSDLEGCTLTWGHKEGRIENSVDGSLFADRGSRKALKGWPLPNR